MREQILFEKVCSAKFQSLDQPSHLNLKSTEIRTFAEAWSKYKKRILISVAVQSMTSLTGVNVVGEFITFDLLQRFGL